MGDILTAQESAVLVNFDACRAMPLNVGRSGLSARPGSRAGVIPAVPGLCWTPALHARVPSQAVPVFSSPFFPVSSSTLVPSCTTAYLHELDQALLPPTSTCGTPARGLTVTSKFSNSTSIGFGCLLVVFNIKCYRLWTVDGSVRQLALSQTQRRARHIMACPQWCRESARFLDAVLNLLHIASHTPSGNAVELL